MSSAFTFSLLKLSDESSGDQPETQLLLDGQEEQTSIFNMPTEQDGSSDNVEVIIHIFLRNNTKNLFDVAKRYKHDTLI